MAAHALHVARQQRLHALRRRKPGRRFGQRLAMHALHQAAHQFLLVAHMVDHRHGRNAQLPRQRPQAKALRAHGL